jgi:hypothetical protein
MWTHCHPKKNQSIFLNKQEEEKKTRRMQKPYVNADDIFEIIARACHYQGQLTQEDKDLIIQVSDIILAIEDLEFLESVTTSQRCEFLLAHRQFFQVYADSQNMEHVELFSLNELRAIGLADAANKNKLLYRFMMEKNIPKSVWPSVKTTVLLAVTLITITGYYYAYGNLGVLGTTLQTSKETLSWLGTKVMDYLPRASSNSWWGSNIIIPELKNIPLNATLI